jgi:anaerobic ribonucleoside-triphosphate reductase
VSNRIIPPQKELKKELHQLAREQPLTECLRCGAPGQRFLRRCPKCGRRERRVLKRSASTHIRGHW